MIFSYLRRLFCIQYLTILTFEFLIFSILHYISYFQYFFKHNKYSKIIFNNSLMEITDSRKFDLDYLESYAFQFLLRSFSKSNLAIQIFLNLYVQTVRFIFFYIKTTHCYIHPYGFDDILVWYDMIV